MKNLFFVIFLLFSANSLTSCASSKSSLQRATATEIGNTLSSEVIISNVKRGATNVSWDAKKGDKCYKCEADDMVRRVNCKEVSCKNN